MTYINVGARINGSRPASKKALKEALANDPRSVHFDGTALVGQQFDGDATAIPAGATLQVTGPDPYVSRRWYASVSVKAGKVTIK